MYVLLSTRLNSKYTNIDNKVKNIMAIAIVNKYPTFFISSEIKLIILDFLSSSSLFLSAFSVL